MPKMASGVFLTPQIGLCGDIPGVTSTYSINVSVNLCYRLLQNQITVYTKFLTMQDDGFKLTFMVLISVLRK